MADARLLRIGFVFPNTTPAARAFWDALVQLLGNLPQADVQPDHLRLTPLQPVGALPATSFHLADGPRPQIVFLPAPQLDLTVGGLHLGTGRPQRPIPTAGNAPPAHLALHDVARRVQGHVTRLDHTGVNLPTRLVERARWDDLVRRCATSAALYRYPGEDWPFILPATEAEFLGDIRHFALGREPKFELVYDGRATEPVLQFNLGTDLSRAEIEARFPDPEGVAIPGLEEIFRTVFVTHPWSQVSIRFDLSYQGAAEASDWETGEWLVVNGGRIPAPDRP